MDKDILHKEIDLIQGVITRMANNSFLLKGWLISLIAVILALSKETIVASGLAYFNFTICLPIIVFWYLDAFFLHKERCYRKLYEWVIENRKSTDDYLYSLNYVRFEKLVDGILKTMLSRTLLPFYGLLFAIVVLIILFPYK